MAVVWVRVSLLYFHFSVVLKIFWGILIIALMRYRAESGQGAPARLHADSSVLRQIIIDKYPAAGQYVRLLLQNNMTDVWVPVRQARVRSVS